MDEISSEELFNSALSNETIEAPEAVVEVESQDDRQRDEQGRFATKSEEPTPVEPQAKPEPKETESVGMRQLREAYERQERRNAELQQQLQAMLPKPEPVAKPDIFDAPTDFVRSNIDEVVAPIQQRFSNFVEKVSRRDAIREHGEDRVAEAYGALEQATRSGDPQARAFAVSVQDSDDPYGDIVSWHSKNEASLNPDGFAQKWLEKRLQDEKFKGELMAKLQPQTEQASSEPVFKLPPSIGRVASAQAASSDLGDLSNESLFKHAMR